MKLSVIGTGYVGLVSGVCLSHVGHDVTCVDLDAAKVDRINNGECPIHEDGLADLLSGVLGKRFRATTDLKHAVMASDMTLIAVGTPFGEERIDLGQITSAAFAIGEAMAEKEGYHLVAVKSTVVPGTTETEVLPRLEQASGKRAGEDFGVGMNPEFLREGVAVKDFLNPDRIVVGGIDDRSRDLMAELYAPFDSTDIVRTTPSTAEMIKYTANALLATLISFSNEVGNVSKAMGVDVNDVLAGVHLDHRFAPLIEHDTSAGERVRPAMLTYLGAGCGFGGSCFPKDVKALVAHARAAGVPVPVLSGALEVNESQPLKMVEMVEHLPQGSHIAVLGVAFKPGTDDIRESPTLRIVPELVNRKYKVTVHDPIAIENARSEFGDTVSYSTSLDAALDGAKAVMLVTSWPEYAALSQHLNETQPLVIDGRRFLDPASYQHYVGIGFPDRSAS